MATGGERLRGRWGRSLVDRIPQHMVTEFSHGLGKTGATELPGVVRYVQT